MAKKRKKEKDHSEAKGFLFIALAFLLLVSFYSFIIDSPSKNYLGVVGHTLGWISFALFGVGSFLLALFVGWVGVKFLAREANKLSQKVLYFLIFLIGFSFLLNVFAELFPAKIQFLHHKIFSETIALGSYPNFKIRYNLGGIPFYYLYLDLPLFNLHNLLSNVGIILIFSSTSLISFLFLSNIQVVPKLKLFFSAIPALLSKLKKLLSFSWEKLERPVIKENLIKDTPSFKPIKSPVKMIEPVKQDEIKQKIIQKFCSVQEPKETKKIDLPIKRKGGYDLPSALILSSPPPIDTPQLKKELEQQANILEETLKSFGIKARVGEINCGPTITSFEVHPDSGVKVQKIKTLENDIALNLQAKSIRIIAPIPGKAAVGVEIPSLYPQSVSLKEMLLYYEQSKKKSAIPLMLGKTVTGEHVIADLARTPHLLIAGATGSGKSVCINTIVMSILMSLSPDEIKLIMIDPKKVELTQYSKLPHMIAPVITEAHGAYAALQWLVREMQKRYEILKQLGLRNITAFNNRKPKKDVEESLGLEIPEKMPLIVAIIDEFADLMMVSSTDLETPIARIAQMARAVGIHLILATQRPSREVITGIIKANFPSRIAFKVASRINSQIILDENGAESLLGNGDLLFLPPGSSHLVRAQGAYISDDDINSVVGHICKQYPPSYLIESFDNMKLEEKDNTSEDDHQDELYDQALDVVLQSRNASTTYLQRKLKIGYARAASLMDELEKNKVIGPQEGSRPRRILSLSNFSEDDN